MNQFEDAAIAVLLKAKQPLSIREIVERMTQLGLAKVTGKTPQNSMSNTIRRANDKRRAMKQPPVFIAHRDGAKVRYSLRAC